MTAPEHDGMVRTPAVRAIGRRRRALGALVLPVLCLVTAAYFVRDAPEISGDSRLALTYAIVDQRSLIIDSYAAQEPAMLEDLAEYDGHLYMGKPPLPSLLAVVPYALLRLVLPPADIDSYWWRWLLTVLVSGGGLVATAVLIERLASEARLPNARLSAVAGVIATPLLAYATLFVATSLGAAFVAGLALAAVRRRYLVAGLVGGAMVSTETVAVASAAVPLALLGLEALRARSVRQAAILIGGFVLGALPLLAYQQAAFGAPLAGIYTYLADPVQRALFANVRPGLPAPDIIASYLFSPRNGFFVVAPIAIVGAVMLARLWRAGPEVRRMVAITGAMAIVTVVAFATLPPEIAFWPRRAEYGTRLLIPLLPLLCWPLAALSARVLAPLVAVCAIPQVIAATLWEPLLDPRATFQVGEVFRRFFGYRPTPSLLGLALPSSVPDRYFIASLVYVMALVSTLAGVAAKSLRQRPA